MKIIIAGAGSIGTVLGVLLHDQGEDVYLLRRSGPTGKVPITITGELEQTKPMDIIFLNKDFNETVDLIIITVQEQHTSQIAHQLQSVDFIGEDTILLSLQNGITASDTLVQNFPNNPVLAGTVWWSATLDNPQTVLYHRKAPTVVGIPEGSIATKDHLDKIAKLLGDSLDVSKTNEILKEQKRKLILNVVSPPLALAKQPYPQGLRDENIRKVVHALFDEALETAYLLDWDIDEEEEEDPRLSQFHDLLISGDIPETSTHDIQHKVSTQIGMEKYGGAGSNIRELLGWLQLSGSQLADEIIALVIQQSSEYNPIDTEILIEIVEFTKSARCPRIPFDTT